MLNLDHVELVLLAALVEDNDDRVVADVALLGAELVVLEQHHGGHMKGHLHDAVGPQERELANAAVVLESAGVVAVVVDALEMDEVAEAAEEALVARRAGGVAEYGALVARLLLAHVEHADLVRVAARQHVQKVHGAIDGRLPLRYE